MYSDTLDTGHQVTWSLPQHLRTTNLVLVFHDAGSTAATAAEHYFNHLPETTTGLAIEAGFAATFGHNWFSTTAHDNPNFAEVMSVAHRVFDAVDEDEYGTSNYASIQLLGIGQGAAVATTMLRIRPEAITSVVGINGYVIDNPMLTALGTEDENAANTPVLWMTTDDGAHPGADFAESWLTRHTDVTMADDPSAITPFLTQKVN